MAKKKEKLIPAEYIGDVGSQTVTIDGRKYLVCNDAMYTFYRRTKGELSPFFLATSENIIGSLPPPATMPMLAIMPIYPFRV